MNEHRAGIANTQPCIEFASERVRGRAHTKARRRSAALGRKPSADQASTLYFLNQAIIWFQPSSAASLR